MGARQTAVSAARMGRFVPPEVDRDSACPFALTGAIARHDGLIPRDETRVT